MVMVYPIYRNAGKRWFIRHFLIALGAGIGVAELYWRLYEVPRKKKRDEFYSNLGVKYRKIID